MTWNNNKVGNTKNGDSRKLQPLYDGLHFCCSLLCSTIVWRELICFNNNSGYGGDCPEGIPVEFGLLAILAAFGVAFGVLYVALTMTVGKRKKRSEESDGTCEAGTIQGYYGCHIEQFMNEQLKSDSLWIHIADVLWLGELN